MRADKLTITWALLTTIICLSLVGVTASEGEHWTLVVVWAVIAIVPASIGFAELVITHLRKETDD